MSSLHMCYLHGGAEALAVLWLHPNDQHLRPHGFDGQGRT